MSSSPAHEDWPACQARFGFGNALHDAAVLQHDVMRRDVGAGRAELRDRALHVGHAGIVQHDHVGLAALVALTIVRRRDDVGRNRGIRGKNLHARVGPGNRKGALTLRINTIRCERTGRHRTIQTGQEDGSGRVLEGRAAIKYSLLYTPRDRQRHWPLHFARVCAASITTPAPAEPAAEARLREPAPSPAYQALLQSHQRFLNAACRY